MKGIYIQCIERKRIFNMIEVLNFSYYIGHRIGEIDRRLHSIQLPKFIRTNLRPMSEREFNHAHEWKFILLFVAYPVLNGILPERYIFIGNLIKQCLINTLFSTIIFSIIFQDI